MSDKEKVLVGLSGGVDSSFAASRLQQQGYEVYGVMFNLWTAPEQTGENRCCSLDSQYLASRVAAKLDIPFYVVDARAEFKDNVVDRFISDYVSGLTPNPCGFCNATVRFKMLVDLADRSGIQWVATGHYARLENPPENDQVVLRKGLDAGKDQSYILSRLSTTQLRRTLLPLGEYSKPQVRKLCNEMGMPTSSRPDSQDLCFLGSLDYREFLNLYAKDRITPGKIINQDGQIIGKHQGLAFYTIGQRKGLEIFEAKPYYVVGKDRESNSLTVSHERAQALASFVVNETNWFVHIEAGDTITSTASIRYRSTEIPVQILIQDAGSAKITLTPPTEVSCTPGQIAAFYQRDMCIGSGIIV